MALSCSFILALHSLRTCLQLESSMRSTEVDLATRARSRCSDARAHCPPRPPRGTKAVRPDSHGTRAQSGLLSPDCLRRPTLRANTTLARQASRLLTLPLRLECHRARTAPLAIIKRISRRWCTLGERFSKSVRFRRTVPRLCVHPRVFASSPRQVSRLCVDARAPGFCADSGCGAAPPYRHPISTYMPCSGSFSGSAAARCGGVR